MHLQQGPHIDSLKLFLCPAHQATRRWGGDYTSNHARGAFWM